MNTNQKRVNPIETFSLPRFPHEEPFGFCRDTNEVFIPACLYFSTDDAARVVAAHDGVTTVCFEGTLLVPATWLRRQALAAIDKAESKARHAITPRRGVK